MTFGIKAYICSSTPSYYVGEEAALWEWLLADNGVPGKRSDMLLVPAPPGYEFRRDCLNGDDQSEIEGLYVNVKSPRSDKAFKLIEILPRVEEAEFESLNIGEPDLMKIYI